MEKDNNTSFNVLLDKLPGYIYFSARNPNDWETLDGVACSAFLSITKTTFGGTTWSVAYITNEIPERSITFLSDWLVGAVAKMSYWLLENNYKLNERE